MKKSKAETAETRRRIVEIASQEFRRSGIQATSVSEIMSAAGLTHGGFYRHFESKEHLLAEACATAMGHLAENASAAVDGGKRAFDRYLSEFLSRAFHEDCAGSCTFVTMGSELARADEQTRHVMSEGFRSWVDILTRQANKEDSKAARGEAMFKLSAMIGAVTMARIIDDGKFADQLLTETRKRLVNSPSKTLKKAKELEPV